MAHFAGTTLGTTRSGFTDWGICTRRRIQRAAALSDAPEGSPQATEFQQLADEIRGWDEAHKGENSQGPESSDSLLKPDDLPFSGLPGNLGKLKDN
ncbi:hypothetical protein AB4Z10_29200 [Bosea sp. RAF48]|uniref:hypothetical protein n=1 Tax=Bosea sp. RAF48 TaxID=3237480 RepID=UPI003F90E8E7